MVANVQNIRKTEHSLRIFRGTTSHDCDDLVPLPGLSATRARGMMTADAGVGAIGLIVPSISVTSAEGLRARMDSPRSTSARSTTSGSGLRFGEATRCRTLARFPHLLTRSYSGKPAVVCIDKQILHFAPKPDRDVEQRGLCRSIRRPEAIRRSTWSQFDPGRRTARLNRRSLQRSTPDGAGRRKDQ